MFSALTQRLSRVLDRIRAGGRVTEADLDEALREIRLALLEADVSFKVAKEFLARVREKALGEDVIKSLTPGQQVVKIVREELASLMGGTSAEVVFSPRPREYSMSQRMPRATLHWYLRACSRMRKGMSQVLESSK